MTLHSTIISGMSAISLQSRVVIVIPHANLQQYGCFLTPFCWIIMVNALLTIMDRYRERKPCYTRCHFVTSSTLMIFGKLHYLLKWQKQL